MPLKPLLDQAKGWQDIAQLLSEEGWPMGEYRTWQEEVTAALRELPNAVDNLKKFTRLQKHRDYAWYPDLAGIEERLELVEKSIVQSIDLLESILND